MRKIFLFLFSLLGVTLLYSQNDVALKKQFGFEVNVVSPGFGVSYEYPLSKNWLLDLSGGLAMPIIKGWGSFNIDDSSINPYTDLELKYYYNRAKRLRKGKEISFNRGNFFGVQSKAMYGLQSAYSTVLMNEIHWGVQTELAKKLLLTFQIGGAHYYTKAQEHYFSPILDFKFKYILF